MVCTGPLTCVKHTSNCTKKVSYSFFFGVVRLGECLEGGEMVHVSGGRGLHGVSEGAG